MFESPFPIIDREMKFCEKLQSSTASEQQVSEQCAEKIWLPSTDMSY